MGQGQRVPGQRAGQDLGGGSGGLREGDALTQQHDQDAGGEDFAAGIRALGGRLSLLRVIPSHGRRAGDIALDAPVRRPAQITWWIEAYRRLTVAQSGVCPPGVASTFVLQFHLDAFARVVATAALTGPWLLDTDPGRYALVLDPTYLFPVQVRVTKGESRVVEDAGERVRLAEHGYRAAATELAQSFPSVEKMSSRQRLGMVDDMWARAVHQCTGGPAPRRRSCCLMYALPGLDVCAGCPRT